MDFTNRLEIIPDPSVVECISNLTDEDSTRKSQADEVSNEIATNNLKKSEGKNSKQAAKEGKVSLKRKQPTEEKLPVKRKMANSLPVSQMVMDSIKALRKRKGASVHAILEHMEGQYKVDVKLIKRHVTRFLLSAVEKDIVEQFSVAGEDEKFKIKKAEKIPKAEKKLNANQRMAQIAKDTKICHMLDSYQNKIKAKKIVKGDTSQKQMAKGQKVAKVDKNLNQKRTKVDKVAKFE